ncbi:ABC-F type ribosomal protection protein [Schnuerera sp. xch1]|uniref:ribosomal protection-like ABC-F family protein n=1 Tax=Schnuerera sp. xch1 TaxID=2874283 RepID=UPI001CBF45DC|nr:ABC-F type ribosomal protection protein [Schnuerera sp. xch1]MBZ2174211.1 ABC-F type ribosomal protection protein [Schnuerera sp. xch1]
MLVLEIDNLKKYYGIRKILDIKNFKVYKKDRIGIVGLNGSGKTTLLNLISKDIEPEKGYIKVIGNMSYIRQLEIVDKKLTYGKYISEFGVKDKNEEFMSGGEITRLKIAKSLSENPVLLLADEPTSNLDFEGIDKFTKSLFKFDGALLMVSHDRDLLDKVCNKILEIQDGHIKIYEGNYSDYKKQKELEIKTKEAEYEKYIKEKKRLRRAAIETKSKSKSIKTTPKRMGNSEARIHKMGSQSAKRALDKKAKAIKTRLEKLEVKEKAKDIDKIKVDISGAEIHSKIIIEGEKVAKSFGDRLLFHNGDFQIYNGRKTALIGANGSGKTTLLNMIINEDEKINISKKAKIGYFNQDLSILDEEKSIIDNIMDSSIYDETTIRTILARFLFKRNDVYKKVNVLSGGERVKVSLAKILMSDFNILILDEPTNYLDIYSIEAIEEALIDYNGTILFVSHDRRFIEKVADNIISIEDKKIKTFSGTLKEFESRKRKSKDEDVEQTMEKKAVLEYRMSQVVGKLSMPSKDDDVEALDREYKQILKKLKEFKR